MAVDIIIPIIIFSAMLIIIWRMRRNKDRRNYDVSHVVTKTKPVRNKAQQATKIQSDSLPNDLLNRINEGQTVAEAPANLPEGFIDFKLLHRDMLDDEIKQSVDKIIYSFRRPHPLLLPLTQGVFEPNELFDLVKTDPEMTAKILNVVNSASFGLRQPITSVNHAIIFMGVSTVKNIAMRFAMQNSTAFNDDEQNKAYKKIWSASFLASSFGLLIAKTLGKDNAAELSTHCLLCYLGDMAMLSYEPDVASSYLSTDSLFAQVKSTQDRMHMNPAITGAILAEQWDLPKSIAKGIENSLLPLTNETFTRGLSAQEINDTLLCYLACRLGDVAVFHGLKDFSSIGSKGLDALLGVDFHFVKQNIKEAHFDKLNECLMDASFVRKANELIAKS